MTSDSQANFVPVTMDFVRGREGDDRISSGNARRLSPSNSVYLFERVDEGIRNVVYYFSPAAFIRERDARVESWREPLPFSTFFSFFFFYRQDSLPFTRV